MTSTLKDPENYTETAFQVWEVTAQGGQFLYASLGAEGAARDEATRLNTNPPQNHRPGSVYVAVVATTTFREARA